MKLEETLASLPPDQWVTRQAIVFDWYDGPREGVCALNNPKVEFRFTLVAERNNPEGLDDRFFRLQEMPAGSVDRILDLLKPELGGPTHSVWVPLWRFSSDIVRRQIEDSLKEIESKARTTSIVVSSRDLEEFKGRWTVDPNMPESTDYASVLGLLPHATE